MRKGFKGVVIVTYAAVLITGILSGCGLAPEADETLAPKLIQPKRTEYELYKVVKKDLTNSLKGSATLIAQKEESLYYSETGGRISKIEAKVGDEVKKGDVLIRLESGDLESRYKTQQNLTKKAEIQLDSLKKQYDKYLSMDKNYQPTPKEMDDMQTNIRLQELDLDNSRIAMEEMDRELTDSILAAPFDGIVTFLENYKEGDTVDAYKAVITVADPKSLELYYQTTSSTDVKNVKMGMKVKATLNGTDYQGEVILCPDNAPKDALDKYKNAIIMKIAELPKGLKWGDYMDFVIDIQTRKDALCVPKTAINGALEADRYVYILDGDSKKQVSVELGMQTTFDVEVKSGLKEGQSVILN